MTQISVSVVLSSGLEAKWRKSFCRALEKVDTAKITIYGTLPQSLGSEWGDLFFSRGKTSIVSSDQGGLPWLSSDIETLSTNCDLLIDLTTTGAVSSPPGVEVWRLERGDGHPLFAPFPFVNDAFKQDRTLTVFLKEWRPNSHDGRYLDVVRVRATGQGYRAMLREVLRCCESMVAANLRGRSLGPLAQAAPIAEFDLSADARTGGLKLDGIASLFRFFGRAGADFVWTRILSKVFIEQWRVGVIHSPISESLSGFQAAHVEWLELAMPPGFAADPFSLTTMQNHFYCEVYEFADGKGRIVEVSLNEAADDGRLRIAREVDFGHSSHLSYPYLFEENGAVFCIPECLGNREIAIYKQDPATGAWKKLCIAMANIEAADPTLFKHDGFYWIGYTDTRIGLWNNYCLLYAEEPSGVWRPHLNNPVKHDVSCSRPAGTPFLCEGRLYRPSQDCSVTYGGSVVINRIVDCTPETFREEVAFVLKADKIGPRPDGIHTVAAWGDRTLIDGKRYVFSLEALWCKALGKVRRRLFPTESNTSRRNLRQCMAFDQSKQILTAAKTKITKSDLVKGKLPR